jgi:putative heme iron utilization protein
MDPNTIEEPLTEEAKTAIMAHMNEDHGKHMVEYAQYLGNVKNAIGARMVNLDNKGIELQVQIEGNTEQTVRIPYPREIQTRKECKNVLIEMVKMAATKKKEEGTL